MDVVDFALETVYENSEPDDWSAYELPRPLFVVWAIEKAQETTNNGSFQYFFERDWPGNPLYSIFIDAFREVGAVQTAECLEAAVHEFPFENPHLDCEKRLSYLDESGSSSMSSDSKIDQLGLRVMDLSDDNYAKLAQYIQKNESYFLYLKKQ